jgi:hypothetical protein
MNKFKLIAFALLLMFGIAACGGGGGTDDDNGGYTGSTDPADISTNNADELALAATSGTATAIAQNAAPSGGFTSVSRQLVVLGLTSRNRSANRTANEPIAGVCESGTADFTANDDYTDIVIIYSDCVISDYNGSYIVDGRFEMHEAPDGSFSMAYQNFRITYAGETYYLNMSVQCDAEYNCTWSSEGEGIDGRTYRVEGASVTTTGSNSYSVSATVYDPDYGYFEVQSNVTYGSCSYGVPSSGTITVTDGNGDTMLIVFNDCDSFTVTVDGVSTTYTWAELLAG